MRAAPSSRRAPLRPTALPSLSETRRGDEGGGRGADAVAPSRRTLQCMEAPDRCLATGEPSGGPDAPTAESHPRGQRSTSPLPPLQPRPRRRPHPQRKRLGRQRAEADQDEGPDPPAASSFSPEAPPPSARGGTPEQKRERKPQRPGKYVCTYCSRACAKPSVLQKHIRSHTGERPYPCGPCGFSFKTKSNLYKHRKSHTHRVKAGLVAGGPRSAEDQPSESEDDTRLSHAERQCEAALRSREMERSQDWAGGGHDSYAVKKRLALRLSRARHGPQDPPGPGASAPTFGSTQVKDAGILTMISPQERKRQEAIFEIMTSEHSYLHSLGILVRHFHNNGALRKTMTATEHHHLFSNIAVIHQISQRFFEDLERRHYENPVIRDISDIVQNHASNHFKPYIVYCSNETFQQRTLQKLLSSNAAPLYWPFAVDDVHGPPHMAAMDVIATVTPS